MAGIHVTCGDKSSPILPGGLSAEKPAKPEIQAICDSVKSDFMEQAGVNATKFEAVSYKSQVVAGTNYFIKVDLGGNQFSHLKIFKPLPYTGEKAKLTDYQMGKTKEDAIGYF